MSLAVLLAAVLLSCSKDKVSNGSGSSGKFTYPDFAEALHPDTLIQSGGVVVYNGGFGSSLVKDPHNDSVFYLMTDRGPNTTDPSNSNLITFPKPDFTPQIGVFVVRGNLLILQRKILLKTKAGAFINGLPNPSNLGGTGETAYKPDGSIIAPSADGMDSEGLTMASDGTFWISDEYGPHIVHYDQNGTEIERFNPFSTGDSIVPLVFARRKPNRGMEGLTLTPDGKTLVGIMQSPLLNPTAADVKNSVVLRVITIDLATKNTKQYAYLLDNPSLTGVSEIRAVNNTTFLTLERDGNFATDATRSQVFKKVFSFSIDGATDISDNTNSAAGKLFNAKTIEQLIDASGLQSNSIIPVKKTLVADLMTDITSLYPHDKSEGLEIINSSMIAVSNDDDFGITTDANGKLAQKILPGNGSVDVNTIYFIKLKTPLNTSGL